jgi:hypothetical protein
MTKYVKYVGTSHWREITDKQWAALEPPVECGTLRWDAANGWTLPADKITDDAWPYIDADNELVIIDKDYRAPKKVDDDSTEADPVLYPPLATAAMAEDIDSAATERVEVVGAVPADNNPPDQSTGSVSVDQEPERSGSVGN